MKTPICDFCQKYANNRAIRLHMPGHKGKNTQNFTDITEIDGADFLYSPEGIIKESQENASSLFGTQKTIYSTEGSSQVMRAMVYLAKVYSGKSKILATRNAHKTFVNACAFCDVEIDWLKTDGGIIDCKVSAKHIESALDKNDLPMAVYLTSPDYLGNICDIEGISKVCKKYGVLLLVDNAHGSYLKFLNPSLHPIDLGADMCSDSAHKTLNALTGAGYFHLSKTCPKNICDEAENAMSLFGSTSPSYLILQSLDKLNKEIFDSKSEFEKTKDLVKTLKNRLIDQDFTVFSDEPFKLTISSRSYGYTGKELNKILNDNNIFCEYYDEDFVVMMFSTKTETVEYEKIFEVFSRILKRQPINSKPIFFELPKKVISLKEAIFSQKERISVKDALGRILAGGAFSCPPCVLIVAPGEEISLDAIKIYEYYGIKDCLVVKYL